MNLRKWALLFFLSFLFIVFAEEGVADPVDYHILNIGINLGWASATIQSVDVTNESTSYLSMAFSNAVAHMSEVDRQSVVLFSSSPSLEDFIPDVSGFLSRTSSSLYSKWRKIAEVGSILNKLKMRLNDTFGSGAAAPACKAKFLTVGFEFGRAMIAAAYQNGGLRSTAYSSLIVRISEGLDIQKSRQSNEFNTPTVWSDWKFSVRESEAFKTYTDSLYPLQAIAWNANGYKPAPPAPEPPPMPLLPESLEDMILGVWGNINAIDGSVIMEVKIIKQGNRIIGIWTKLRQACPGAIFWEFLRKINSDTYLVKWNSYDGECRLQRTSNVLFKFIGKGIGMGFMQSNDVQNPNFSHTMWKKIR